MEPWTPFHSNLRDLLVGLFDSRQLAKEVATEAELDPSDIVMDGSLRSIWFNVVDYARRRKLIDELIDAAIGREPKSVDLKRAKARQLSGIESPSDIHDVLWTSKTDETQYEKITANENTLLPIGFLELGLERAKSVVRILTTDPKSGQPACGTGFLLAKNWLLTNHHVLPSEKQAAEAEIQFNYEHTATGLEKSPIPYRLQADNGNFHTNAMDDWTLVRIAGNANVQWGAIELSPVTIAKRNRVIVIQHLSGGHKQIGLVHNLVTYADDRIVQYLTDTQPGSSGAPVFDERWNVVALHHSGGWLREPGLKNQVFRNEGIAIPRVLNGIGEFLSN